MGCMVVRNMWFCMDLLTGWSSLISMPASIHKSIATSLNAWSILLEYLQHTLQLMQCNESNILKRREHFENQDNSRIFIRRKNSQDSTKFYIITKLIPNYIILTDVFIVLLKHLLHQLINFLACNWKKNKAIKCKKLMFKKWIYIQINAKKETR